MRGIGYLTGTTLTITGLAGAFTNLTGDFMPWLWTAAAGFVVVVLTSVTDVADTETSARLSLVDQELESEGL